MVLHSTEKDSLTPLQLRNELGLSHERLAAVVGVGTEAIQRWEEEGRAPTSRYARQRLTALHEILELGRLVYTPEGMRTCFSTPQPRFRGATALELIETNRSAEVVAALAEDYEGLGP